MKKKLLRLILIGIFVLSVIAFVVLRGDNRTLSERNPVEGELVLPQWFVAEYMNVPDAQQMRIALDTPTVRALAKLMDNGRRGKSCKCAAQAFFKITFEDGTFKEYEVIAHGGVRDRRGNIEVDKRALIDLLLSGVETNQEFEKIFFLEN